MSNVHPVRAILLGATQMILVASTLTYAPKTSPLRFVSFALVLGLGYLWYWSCSQLTTSGLWNGTCAATVVIYCLHHIDLVLIKKVDRAGLLDTSQPKYDAGFLRALHLSFSTRSVNSKWQIGNVTAFPAYYRDSKNPGRLSYLFRTTVIFAWQYLILDLIDVQMAQQSLEEKEELYGNGQEFVFFNSTKQQLGTRVLTGVAGSFFIGRIIMDCIYRLMSLIAVGTGISKPRDWPPFFGRMRDAYSVRTFWGKFWHQWLRGPLSAVSSFTSRRILGLPKRSLLEWYTNVFMTFTLSAAIHVLNDIVAGKGVVSGTVLQFQGFAAAMLVEDGVQALLSQFTGPEKPDSSKQQTAAWRRYVGYAWVVCVLCIVVPWYLYPSGRMPAGAMWTVPFSVVGVLGIQKAGIAIVACSLIIIRSIFMQNKLDSWSTF